MAKRLWSILISSGVFNGSSSIFATQYLSSVRAWIYSEGVLSQAGKVDVMSIIAKLMIGFLLARLVILCMNGSVSQINSNVY